MSVHNGLIDDSTEMLITDVRQQTMEDPSPTGPLVLHTSAATPVAVRCMSQRTEGAENPRLGVGEDSPLKIVKKNVYEYLPMKCNITGNYSR